MLKIVRASEVKNHTSMCKLLCSLKHRLLQGITQRASIRRSDGLVMVCGQTSPNTLDCLGYSTTTMKGLLAHHPGCAALTAAHAATINDALARYKQRHPNAVARFVGETGDSADASLADRTLARLEWLAFWVDWAVKNCERPAMQNS